MLPNQPGSEAVERARSFIYKAAVLNKDGVTPAKSREDPAVLKQLKKKFKELCDPPAHQPAIYAMNSQENPSNVAELRNEVSTCMSLW